MNKVYSKVFMWMFIGLLITFITGFYVSTNENILYTIFSTSMFWILILLEFGTVIFLSARISKMSITTARIAFIAYSFLTGLTFSVIFVAYQLGSILLVFLITSLLFAIFAIIGAFTKIDLTKWGTYLIMGLFGIILASIINMFVGNTTADLIISIIGVVIFVIFIAYDMQKIKRLSEVYDEDKLAIAGALELYLDFINLFLRLLNLLGGRRK